MNIIRKILPAVLIGLIQLSVTAAWETKLTDLADPVFTDRFPQQAVLEQPIPTPRGRKIAFLALTRSDDAGPVQFRFAKPPVRLDQGAFGGKLELRELIPVHVEGNLQDEKNIPGGKVRPEWLPHFIREAPFDLLEAVDNRPHQSLDPGPGKTGGVLAEITIPANAAPGIYYGELEALRGKESRKMIYSFEIFAVTPDEGKAIDSMHWLWIEPENLTSGKVPEYWSEAHWQLIEAAGRQLHASGDNVVFTPLIFGKVPLIQTVKNADGSYQFDFTGFRRWLKLFDTLGYRGFVGTHLHSWMLPLNIRDAGAAKLRFVALDAPERREVLKAFLPQLRAELERSGYLDRYRQHLMDEPLDKDIPTYLDYDKLFRATMPDVKNLDATIRTATLPHTDYAVMHVQKLRFSQALNAERRKSGKSFWIYSSCNPWPPFPNRQLDRPAVSNRLYPILAVKYNCDGYLNWAANIYRGADEYAKSLGPYPDGSQNPGHPPGDAWFFYRGPDGLRTGLRMLNFRDGITDTALLNMLRAKAPEAVPGLIDRVYFAAWEFPDRLNIYARPYAGYTGRAFATDPASYHAMRRAVLKELSKP